MANLIDLNQIKYFKIHPLAEGLSMNNRRILVFLSVSTLFLNIFPVPNPKGVGQVPYSPQKQSDGAHIQDMVLDKIGDCDYIQFAVAPAASAADSAYHAVKNAYISLGIQDPINNENTTLTRLNDNNLVKKYITESQSPWRLEVIKNRKVRRANEFIKKMLSEHITTTYEADRSAGQSVFNEVVELSQILSSATLHLSQQLVETTGLKTVTEKVILTELIKQEEIFAKANAKKSLSPERITHYIANLPPISFTLETTKNAVILKSNNKLIKEDHYGPQKDSQEIQDGSWLSMNDIIDLDICLKSHTAEDFPEGKKIVPLGILSSSKEDIFLNIKSYDGLTRELSKKPKEFTALFFIECSDKQWISCVVTKEGSEVAFVVTDSENLNRQDEPTIRTLAEVIKTALAKGPQHSVMAQAPQNNNKSADKEEEHVNYDAPLAHVPLSEIPTLEQIFGGKVPNNIKRLISYLKRKGLNPEHASIALKNCLLLYGPPGTGKTTVAQLIARELGWEMVFAGGGDFRTAYQGSGKAKIDAFFAEAIKRAKKSNLPVMLIFDEIDGMASALRDTGGTNLNLEDSRAMKALVTTLDQYRYDPNIFIVGTSNYPERLDPAIRRRFDTIKIPLPDYSMRQATIKYYLNKNNIAIKEDDENSVTPYFLSRLTSATTGFSQDGIGNMINTACFDAKEEAHEAQELQSQIAEDLKVDPKQRSGFKPENKISLGFRFNGINVREKSLLANGFELLSLPLVPLFHLFSEETRIAQHIYSQYLIQSKLMSEMKLDEASNHPLYRYAKFGDEPLFWAKETGLKGVDILHGQVSNALAVGVTTLVTSGALFALKYCYDKLTKVAPSLTEKAPRMPGSLAENKE